ADLGRTEQWRHPGADHPDQRHGRLRILVALGADIGVPAGVTAGRDAAPSWSRPPRKLDGTRLPRRVIHPPCRLPIIIQLGPEDVRDEGLRIPVVEREPARLYLYHDAVSW